MRSHRRARDRSSRRENKSSNTKYRKSSRSSSNHRPRHSRTPSPKRDIENCKRRRDTSRSPRRDRYRDSYRSRRESNSPQNASSSRRFDLSPSSNYRHHKDLSTQSSDDPKVRNESRSQHLAPSSLGELVSANQHHLLQQQKQQPKQQEQQHPEALHDSTAESKQPTAPDSKGAALQSALSPSTFYQDDSTSSDIYDPAGPVIPISPGDSPPLTPMLNDSYQDSPQDNISPPREEALSDNNDVMDNGPADDDIIPSSAVQLNHHEKYLQKLNRQERVIEEVKVALKPYYSKRTIDKEQYKDVLRRAVPKICHNKNGEINPIKIRSLVDAYVKKMKRHRF